MLMVKFCSPQNSARVSQEKSIAVISQTIEVNGDQVLHFKKINKWSVSLLLVQSNQGSWSLDMSSCFEKMKNVMFLASLFTVAWGSEHGNTEQCLQANLEVWCQQQHQTCQTCPLIDPADRQALLDPS